MTLLDLPHGKTQIMNLENSTEKWTNEGEEGGIEDDKFKPTTSRPPALHLQPYSSVSVWRGTEGGGVDAHRKRHLNQDYLTCGNKRKGAYGCCLDLMTCLAKH